MVRKHSLTEQRSWFRAQRITAGALVSNLGASTRATALTALSPDARPVRLSGVSCAVVASVSCVFDVRHSPYGCARTRASVSGWCRESLSDSLLLHGHPFSRATAAPPGTRCKRLIHMSLYSTGNRVPAPTGHRSTSGARHQLQERTSFTMLHGQPSVLPRPPLQLPCPPHAALQRVV